MDMEARGLLDATETDREMESIRACGCESEVLIACSDSWVFPTGDLELVRKSVILDRKLMSSWI